MIRPPRLRRGDLVRVVAPSGPVARDDFEIGRSVLAERYDVRFDDGLFASEGFLAGSDERRLAELSSALADPDAVAVAIARGGHGALRLLPRLDAAPLRAHPKTMFGFSDGTALLAWCAHSGVASVHGPVATQLGRLPAEDREALFRLLEEPSPGVLLEGLADLVPGRVRGPLVGGNLEVFSRLLGTPFLPPLDGAILFIEDRGERPYQVDRQLAHLDLAGVFSAVSAVVVGDFAGCVEPETTRAGVPTAVEVLEERLGRLAIPVALGALVGHGTRNRALPYGTSAELDTRNGTLVAVEGAVS